MKRLWGFICCLFDAHSLRYDGPCDWWVCERCGEVRLSRAELDKITATLDRVRS